MLKKLFLLLAGITTGAACVLSILTRPLLRRLPKEGRVSLDGILTIDDAIAACHKSGLQDWELVAYAQKLAERKFTYSRLNPWDTPARAFERGRGYCQQQALALKKSMMGWVSRPGRSSPRAVHFPRRWWVACLLRRESQATIG